MASSHSSIETSKSTSQGNILSALTLSSDLPAVLFSILVVYCLTSCIYSRYFHPLAKYPGPFWATITDLWMVVEIRRGHAEVTQYELHEKYGPVVRIAPNELSISDPSAIKAIYGVKSGFRKSDFFKLFAPSFARYPDHNSIMDPKLHIERRRIVNHLYSTTFITKSEHYIENVIDLFITRMDGFCASGEHFDLILWLQRFAYDTVGELFFGQKIGFLEQQQDVYHFMESLDELVPIIQAASHLKLIYRPFVMLAAMVFPRKREAAKVIDDMGKLSKKYVTSRVDAMQNNEDVRQDFLTSLLQIWQEKGEKLDLTLIDIQVEVYIPLFAGSDTTAIALCSAIYMLMKHPEYCKKLTQELDEAVRNGAVTQPYILYAEAIKLPYLVAVCKESMRIHPSAALTFPRIVPDGGREVAGEIIPGGTIIGVNPYVVHRNKEVYGNDAEDFNPDRWFRPGADEMDRCMFNFGSGARTCIGKNVSLFELYKLIPQLLLRYEFHLVEPDKQWTTKNYGFNKPQNLPVRVTRRVLD